MMHSFCKLLHFICCILFFTLNAFAQSVCEQGFSVVENGDLITSDRVRNDLVRNAEIKLEQDLQAIRNSPQEPLLKAHGFKPSYYLGVDQAREFNKVAKYLRKIKADPKKTHIPYFADQVEKTISDFEKSFRKHNKNNLEFLEERLKILEELKKEARKRIKDQNVTYDWWANFNLRLSIIASEPDLIREISKSRIKGRKEKKLYDINTLTAHEKMQELLSDITANRYTLSDTPNTHFIHALIKEKDNFPSAVMFFTTDELGIMAFNRLEDKSYFVGVTGTSFLTIDGRKVNAFEFFFHDVGHMQRMQQYSKDQEILKRIDSISTKSDREKAELVLFLYHHEDGWHNFNKELLEYYKSAETNLSQSKLRQLTTDTKKYIKGMMLSMDNRFAYPDDLQHLLPDDLNIGIDNTEEELEVFFSEYADIFADILLAR